MKEQMKEDGNCTPVQEFDLPMRRRLEISSLDYPCLAEEAFLDPAAGCRHPECQSQTATGETGNDYRWVSSVIEDMDTGK